MKKTVIVGGMLALLGCSVAVMEGVRHADGVMQGEQKPALQMSSTTHFAYSNKYGNYLAGRTASMAGDHPHAAQFLGQIAYLEKEKAPPSLVLSAMRHYILAGDMEKAITLAQRVMEKEAVTEKQAHKAASQKKKEAAPHFQPLHENAKLLLLVSALQKGNMQEADTQLVQLQQQGIGGLFVPFISSWLRFAKDGTIKRVTVADALPHGQFRTVQYYHEALQYEVAKDYAKAATAYTALLADMEYVPDSALLSSVHFFATHDQEEQARLMLEKYRANHARDAFWQVRSTDEYLAEIKVWEGFAVQSASDGVAESLANIGQLLSAEGAHQEGQLLLQLARYLRPTNMFYSFLLASSMEENDQHDAALSLYQQITSPAWLHEVAEMAQARALHGKGEVAQARALLQDIAKESKASYNVAVMLGDLERGEKQYEEAAAYYSTALKAIGTPQPIDWPLIFRRGVVYDQLEEWRKAEDDFSLALKLSPDEPEIMNYLAYSWLLRGEKLDEAAAMLQQAVSAKPESAQIIDSYGWALYHQGEYKKSLAFLEKALTMIPSDATVNDHYGDVLWQLGRHTEARFHWQRALVFKPTEKGARAAIKEKLEHGLAVKKPSLTMRQSNAK